MSIPGISPNLPPPTIIPLAGEDLDSSWGASKTFVRERKFELINVPLPLFMLSPFVPPSRVRVQNATRCSRLHFGV